MKKLTLLQYGKYYHIYNCGINSCALFNEKGDYEHFLYLYDKYIEPVANTFAWVLMGNHFHLLAQIKEENEIGYYRKLRSDKSDDSFRFSVTHDLSEFEEPERVKKPNPTKHFSHLFNAYAKFFNKKHKRHGSLFEKPFKRKLIDSEIYFRRVVLYIHNNPVHHSFCEHTLQYPWSSYLTCISVKPTKLQRNTVIGWFDDMANFKYLHNEKVEVTKIEKWLEL